MGEVIEGTWDDLVARRDLQGRRIRVRVLENDEGQLDPWVKSLRAWAESHKPVGHAIDDSRESIYSGTADDPR